MDDVGFDQGLLAVGVEGEVEEHGEGEGEGLGEGGGGLGEGEDVGDGILCLGEEVPVVSADLGEGRERLQGIIMSFRGIRLHLRHPLSHGVRRFVSSIHSSSPSGILGRDLLLLVVFYDICK